jgi:archaellum component FlaC
MSVGDWFTLRPLNFNFDDINQRLTNVETQLTSLDTRVTTAESQLTNLNSRMTTAESQLVFLNNYVYGLNNFVGDIQNQLNAVAAIATSNQASINNLNTQVSNFNTQLTNLSNTVNSMQTNINNILDLYKPISWFNYASVRFTDISGNTTYGSFRGAWYRPIKFLDVFSNEGVDLKLLVLAIREFTINSIPSGVFYHSDPLILPLPPVNNNDYRVFWSNTVTEHKMNTKEAEYILSYIPINTWSLSVMNRQGPGISSDSAWFFIGYY